MFQYIFISDCNVNSPFWLLDIIVPEGYININLRFRNYLTHIFLNKKSLPYVPSVRDAHLDDGCNFLDDINKKRFLM